MRNFFLRIRLREVDEEEELQLNSGNSVFVATSSVCPGFSSDITPVDELAAKLVFSSFLISSREGGEVILALPFVISCLVGLFDAVSEFRTRVTMPAGTTPAPPSTRIPLASSALPLSRLAHFSLESEATFAFALISEVVQAATCFESAELGTAAVSSWLDNALGTVVSSRLDNAAVSCEPGTAKTWVDGISLLGGELVGVSSAPGGFAGAPWGFAPAPCGLGLGPWGFEHAPEGLDVSATLTANAFSFAMKSL